MYRLLLFLGLAGLWLPAWGQPYTLRQCHEAALAQSPLRRQQDLLATRAELQAHNLRSQWLPLLSVNGQLTYQSDVITFPRLGTVEFPEIPQTQYRATVDASQLLYDAGGIRLAREQTRLEAATGSQEIEVQLNQLRSTVNDLYFGVLLRERQAAVLSSIQAELAERRRSIASGVQNGVLLPSVLDGFDKQAVELAQQLAQSAADQAALRAMLVAWTGIEALTDAPLEVPADLPAWTGDATGQRPEYRLWALQRQQIDLQQQLLKGRLLPRVSAFGQGGLGQPNPFNFLETNLDGFYLIGLRLQWAPWDWGRTRRDQEMLALQGQALEVKQAQFEQSLRALRARDHAQLDALDELIAQDSQMLALQARILRQAQAQFEGGVITAAEYLTEFNTHGRMRLQQEIHRLQRVQAQVNLLTIDGF
ncbi:MAG: TolC family protein [Bacteroidia bacterium]